jgi:hypothetical protein
VDDTEAQYIAEYWSGGAGLVPRGPKVVLAVRPVTPSDVERHLGRRPPTAHGLWRLEVGGRFLRSSGTVYPSGVPFPEELQRRTAVIANEVWLYTDDEGDVIGAYWWPDAMRRPIASMPRDEYPAEMVVDPADVGSRVDFDVRLPKTRTWEPALAVVVGSDEVIVFLTHGAIPDPVHEMLVYENGGLSLRETRERSRPDLDGFLRTHQPPYRQLSVEGSNAVGREPGRSLGPQTWPWPGELRWWAQGVTYELKGFVPLATLQEVAATIS